MPDARITPPEHSNSEQVMSLPTRVSIFGSNIAAALPGELSLLFKDGILIDRRNGSPMEMDGYSAYLALKLWNLRPERALKLTGKDLSKLFCCARESVMASGCTAIGRNRSMNPICGSPLPPFGFSSMLGATTFSRIRRQ